MIKTRQFAHQAAIYERARDKEFYALFWEMGLGKTKLLLDVAAHLHERGKINGLLVVAPNEVYKNWITQEAPRHLGAPYVGIPYPKTMSEKDELRRMIFLDPDFEPSRLKLVSMSYDSICTLHGYEFARRFVVLYRTMMVCDESDVICNAKATRTVKVKKIGMNASHRWIATGTPVSKSPFDVHSQVEFLCPWFWEACGMRSISAFKNQFAEFKPTKIYVRGGGSRIVNKVEGYRRLDYLNSLLKDVSSRLLKEDSGVELPPKTYVTRTFEMTPGQRLTYDQLAKQMIAELDDGKLVDARLAIVRIARLQQITSGFVSAEEFVLPDEDLPDDEAMLKTDVKRVIVDLMKPEDNPRIQLLQQILSETGGHKVIVWCRFRREVDQICRLLGSECVRYDGAVSSGDKERALSRFCDEKDSARVLVANVHAMSRGVTLTIAKTMIYYSNTYRMPQRLQSEDRFHRIGQTSPVLIVDIAAENTVDERVIDNLRNKYDIAAQVAGDRLREWISGVKKES